MGDLEYGIRFPFTIAGGKVLTSTVPGEVILSRITFCLGTQVGERVMRPEWGIDILNSVHAMGGSLEASVREAVQDAFNQWFPDYQLRAFALTQDKNQPSLVTIEIRYGKYGSDLDESLRVSTLMDSTAEFTVGEGR